MDKIFDRVEQNPENISDIRRLMEYYLPTTVKLWKHTRSWMLSPYRVREHYFIKKEIEKTLDTLNVAFEKTSGQLI